jgi:nucleotide-binding universal stress UspA family protein
MDRVDQFESAFRSAAKQVFHYRPLVMRSVLIVTDRNGDAAERFSADVQALTGVLGVRGEVTYDTVTGDRFTSPKDLLDLVEQLDPDLIVTYRCLHSKAWRWDFTLGAHTDVLTQATKTPVLLVPHPDRDNAPATSKGGAAPGVTDRVMAVTDHLAGDERLVNAALTFAEPRGTLFLSHVEDDATFERYLSVIGRIPEIETELARERIHAQLLKEPADYIRSVSEALAAAKVACTVEQLVSMGRHVSQYRESVESFAIDLLVLNTKDEDHSAMHGLAYPLAVELRDIPLLML